MTNTEATKMETFLTSLAPALSRKGSESVSTAVIRKRVRAELASAIAHGVIPTGTEFSIRGDYNHVTVQITVWPTHPLVAEYTDALMADALGVKTLINAWSDQRSERRRMSWEARNTQPELTAELNAAIALIEQLVERHNYDDSDSMTDHFDVGFYTRIDADPVLRRAEQGIAEEMKPELARKRHAGRSAATRLGKNATKSICGRSGVEACGEWAIDRLIELDLAAAGRPVVYDKRRGRWVIDDTARAAA